MKYWLKILISLCLLASISFVVTDHFALSQDEAYDDYDEENYEDNYEDGDDSDKDKSKDQKNEGSEDGKAAKEEDVALEDLSSELESNEIDPFHYSYQFSLLSDDDPFAPAILMTHLEIEAEDRFEGSFLGEEEEQKHLQKYVLKNMNLVGVWSVGDERKALVMLPGGKGVIVAEGDLIGRKGGKIIEINPQEVIVQEHTTGTENLRQVSVEKITFKKEVIKEETVDPTNP